MFRLTCTLAALLCAALFPLLLVDARIYVETYGVAGDAGAEFLGRRAAPFFAGLAVLYWMARRFEGAARFAVAVASVPIWGGIALTGLYEALSGTAAPLIVAAAAVETAFAVAFWLSRRD